MNAPVRHGHDGARRLVAESYRSILLRDPDEAGLRDYAARLAAGRATPASVRHELHSSHEYRSIVAPVERLIVDAFRLLFDREPSRAERAHYLGALRHAAGDDDAVRDRLLARTADRLLGIRPLNVEMDITNQCNIRCVMCYFSDPAVGRRARRDITDLDFHWIAYQLFPWVNRLSLTLGAEPLIHPDVDRFVALAKAYGVPKVYLNTNAVKLDREMGSRLIEAGIDAMNISLDAGTAPTFERVRRGARFDVVVGNIRDLQEEKRRRGIEQPRLSLSFVMMRSTIAEVPAFLELAADLGVTDVHLVHVVSYANLDSSEESLSTEPERCSAILDEARAIAARRGLVLREPGDFSPPAPGAGNPGAAPPPATPPARHASRPAARQRFDLPVGAEDELRGCCPFPWHFVAINPGGEIHPCGWWYDGEPLGNILHEPFAAIWQGPRFVRLRDDLRRGILGTNCAQCPAAGMGLVTEAGAFSVRRLRGR